MPEESPNNRIEAALASERFDVLHDLALALKAEGMSQRVMYDLFDQYRSKYHNAGDEAKCDTIMDIMDLIVGYCAVSQSLFKPHERDMVS